MVLVLLSFLLLIPSVGFNSSVFNKHMKLPSLSSPTVAFLIYNTIQINIGYSWVTLTLMHYVNVNHSFSSVTVIVAYCKRLYWDLTLLNSETSLCFL